MITSAIRPISSGVNSGNIGSDNTSCAQVSLIADWTYTAKQRNNVEGTFVLNRPSTSVFNASVIYTAPDDRYSLTFGGTNLSNERYVTSGSSIPASGVIDGTFSRPREWYARVGFKF